MELKHTVYECMTWCGWNTLFLAYRLLTHKKNPKRSVFAHRPTDLSVCNSNIAMTAMAEPSSVFIFTAIKTVTMLSSFYLRCVSMEYIGWNCDACAVEYNHLATFDVATQRPVRFYAYDEVSIFLSQQNATGSKIYICYSLVFLNQIFNLSICQWCGIVELGSNFKAVKFKTILPKYLHKVSVMS